MNPNEIIDSYEYEYEVENDQENRFALEENFANFSNIVEDVEYFYNKAEEFEWTEDEKMNYLLGIITKYGKLREDYEMLFEKLIQKGVIR
jgi:hypothetical protein